MLQIQVQHRSIHLPLCYVAMVIISALSVLAGQESSQEKTIENEEPDQKGLYLGPFKIGGMFRVNHSWRDWDSYLAWSGEDHERPSSHP